jgi:hypothetical protein
MASTNTDGGKIGRSKVAIVLKVAVHSWLSVPVAVTSWVCEKIIENITKIRFLKLNLLTILVAQSICCQN